MSIRTDCSLSLFFSRLFLGTAMAMLIACGNETSVASGKGKKGRVLEAVKVETAQSTAAVTRPSIRITGTLYAIEDVTISAKVAGRILSLPHDLGDRVRTRTTLAQIDRTDYQLAVKERESAIRATLAKVGMTEFPSPQANLEEVPTVKRTMVQLGNVNARYERLKKLFDQTPPLISEQEYADAETEWKVARSAFEVEKANAQALLAEAMTLQAELNLANQRLADTDVRSPSSESTLDLSAPLSSTTRGERSGAISATTLFDDKDSNSENPELRFAIAQRFVSVGEYVREGTPLFRLIDDDPAKLRAMVPERYVGQITKNLKAQVSVQSHATAFTGIVSRISPQIDPASRTFIVEILITNPDGQLKPGAFATATIQLPGEQPVVRVPAAAVTSFAGIHKVFTVVDGKAVENRVTLGNREDGTILITTGLEANQPIILSPPAQMVGGTPLILTTPAPSK